MCSPEVMQKVSIEVNRRKFLTRSGAIAGTMIGATAFGHSRSLAQDATPVVVDGSPAPVQLPAAVSQIVDLTHVSTPAFPMFPGAQSMTIDVIVTIEENGFYKNLLTLDEHTGTHMDAPGHFIIDGLTAEKLPVEQLMAPLCVVHINERAATDADAQVTVDDLLAWEAANGPLPDRAFVAMHSGWESRVGDAVAFINADADGVPHFPGFHPDATALLVNERNIVGIGVDTVSLDFGASTDFGSHVTALGAGKFGLENLANLATVPVVGATIIAGGPKHLNASGGPTRAIALV